MTNRVFLDTSYVIAAASPNDLSHSRVRTLAGELKANGTQFITTRAILLEIGNSLSRRRYRSAAVKVLHSMEADPNVEIVPLSERLYGAAFELFRQRSDKEWGLVDCISCIVMQEHDLSEVLTTDEHFAQMGFRILPD